MSAKSIEIVTCGACGTNNRILSASEPGIFRCGTCHAPLMRSVSTRWLVRNNQSAPELLFLFARGVLGFLVLAMPIWVAYISITDPEQKTTNITGTYAPQRPKPIDYVYKNGKLVKSTDAYTSPRPQLAPQPAQPPFNETPLPLPQSGEVYTYPYSRAVALAPFEIKSSFGTNYLVKLADASTGTPVQTIFVRGGTTVKVKVPLGTFSVKYAAGGSWYGYQHLFGPMTAYSKASELFTFKDDSTGYTGYTITLYKVHNGNLQTQQIDPKEF